MTEGYLKKDTPLTVEDVRDHFEEIDDTSQFTVPWQATDETFLVRDLLMPRDRSHAHRHGCATPSRSISIALATRRSCVLLALRFGDPLRVLLAVREREPIERRVLAVLSCCQCVGQRFGNVDDTRRVVPLHDDGDRRAQLDARRGADRLGEPEIRACRRRPRAGTGRACRSPCPVPAAAPRRTPAWRRTAPRPSGRHRDRSPPAPP